MNEITTKILTDTQEREDSVLQLGGYAFSSTPPLPTDWQDWFKGMTNATLIAKMDGDKPVAQVASTPMSQNVRGQVYDVGGVWGVATHPGYRRNGLVRELMADLFKADYEAGRPFSALYPFRASFYGRMGYVTFPKQRHFTFNPRDLSSIRKMPLRGHVELMLLNEGWDILQAFMARYQAVTHGLIIKSEPAILNNKNDKWWLAVAYVDGEAEPTDSAVGGIMLYNNKGNEDNMVMNVHYFYTLDVMARYLLLDWLALHFDQISEIKLRLAPYDRAETWAYELSTRDETGGWPPMCRVLNVAQIGGMRVGRGQVTLKISDDMCPWNNGVWTFASEDGLLTVMAADEGAAECDLTIQALSALVYGVHDPEVFVFHGWGDPTLELQARLRALFPAALPYMHAGF